MAVETRIMNCIMCPLGCEMTVTIEDGADKDQRLAACLEGVPGPIPQGNSLARPDPRQCASQFPAQPLRQGGAPVSKGGEGNLSPAHSFPSRNSVVKAGSYSLLRL